MKIIESIVSEQDRAFVAAVKIRNQLGVAEEKGSAFINQSLAKLYAAVRNAFPGAAVGHIESAEYALVLRLKDDQRAPIPDLRQTLSKAADDCANSVQFICGVFFPATLDDIEEYGIDTDGLDQTKGLDLARYAVSDAGFAPDDGGTIEIFGVETAERVIQSWRNKRDFEKALADYNRLSQMGVAFAAVDNQAGICAIALSKFDIAVAAFAKAVERDKHVAVYWWNLAIAQYKVAGPLVAFESFEIGLAAEPEPEMPDVYKPIYAMASYHKYKEKPDIVDRSILLARLREAYQNYKELLIVNKAEVMRAMFELQKG